MRWKLRNSGGELVDCVDDGGGGVLDEVGVAVGPGGEVAGAVVAGVESGEGGEDVGDRFGFGFVPASVLHIRRRR
jgi:hypothetical protein